MMEFQGFSPETIDFLWGLRLNNNRAWFEPHKAQYQTTLYEPMKALAQALRPSLSDFPELETKVSRIYRDARLHPSTPYKESLWICFRLPDVMWGEQPVFFFELRPDTYSYGFLFWFPRPAQMEQLRRQLVAAPERFCEIVDTLERTTTLRVAGDEFKRPKPCPNPALERYFKLKNFGAYTVRQVDDHLFSPSLTQDVAQCFSELKPLMHYCRAFLPMP